MKISLTLVIEVDPTTWDEIYGHGSGRAEVRADVRSYVLNAIQESPGMLEAEAEVTLR